MASPVYIAEIDFGIAPAASYIHANFTLATGSPAIIADDLLDVPDYIVQAGDVLEYDIYWEGASQFIAFDIGFSDATYARNYITTSGTTFADQAGRAFHPSTDLSAVANGAWYHRSFALDSLAILGKTITKWDIAVSKTQGIGTSQVNGRIRDIKITDGQGVVRLNVWAQPQTLPGNQIDYRNNVASLVFLAKTAEANNWTDVSQWFRPEINYKRGKQTELDTQETGTCTFVLDNRDRRFDPTVVSGPYYPNIRPMRQFRLRATFGATTYNCFKGFIERWPPEWKSGDAYLQVTAVDHGEPANIAKITGSVWPLETTDARVNRVLDMIGQNFADRQLDTGKTNVLGVVPSDLNALQHLQQVALTENGNYYYNGAGKARFENRHSRLLNNASSVVTFGYRSDLGEVAFTDSSSTFDKDRIYNDVAVNSGLANPVEQRAIDYPSQIQYFPRTLGPVSTLLTSDSEALSFAQWLLRRYKDARIRFDTITIEAGRIGTDDVWTQILSREISDRVTVKDRPQVQPGFVIQQDCHIESINVTLGVGTGKAVYSLSPADMQSYWVLDSPTNSVLDSSTVVAY